MKKEVHCELHRSGKDAWNVWEFTDWENLDGGQGEGRV